MQNRVWAFRQKSQTHWVTGESAAAASVLARLRREASSRDPETVTGADRQPDAEKRISRE